MLVSLSRFGDLSEDREVPILHVDVDFLLGQPRKLECSRHKVPFGVLVYVHPEIIPVSV